MPGRRSPRTTGLVGLALLACAAAGASPQDVSVTTAGGALHVRAPGFSFVEGRALARLEDGRAVRVELGMAVLAAPGRSPVATTRKVFAVSYDLWEERFAVTTVDSRAESISHLTAAAAEAWCVAQLAIPLGALGDIRDGTPFWIRLEHRFLDGDGTADQEDESVFTLQALIDLLSRRRTPEPPGNAVEAGPFRLPRSGGAPHST